jgi:hypothetical protein
MMRLTAWMFALWTLLAPTWVWAQANFAAPPPTPYGVSIGIESAKKVAAAAVAEAQKNRWRMAIAIVDTGGHLVYSLARSRSMGACPSSRRAK